MFATESPEWEGLLPLGLASANYTILVAGTYLRRYLERSSEDSALYCLSGR